MFKLTSAYLAKPSLLITLILSLVLASSAFAKPAWKSGGSDSDNPKGKGNGKNKTVVSHDIIVNTSPASQSVTEGDSVSFFVVAESTDGQSISYQWSYNNQPITGANTSSYTIDSALLEDAGEYSVSLTTSFTSISESALLSVEAQPAPGPDIEIYFQPISQSGYEQESLTLNVSASGSGTLYYQWRKNGTAIPDAIHDYLTLSDLSTIDNADYDVVITNATGEIVSDVATITVKQLASISLSWETPSLREDGEVLLLEEIDSYQVYYAYEHEEPQVVTVASSNNSLQLNNMRHGLYYFEIATTDTQGMTGTPSELLAIEVN